MTKVRIVRGLVGRRTGANHAVGHQPDVEDGDFVVRDDVVGRGVRLVARDAFEIEDVAGGDGIEGDTLSQVVGVVELSVLDAGAGLQNLEVLLDGPSALVPGDDGPSGLGVGAALGAQQQPVERVLAGGRVGFGRGQRRACRPAPGSRRRAVAPD